MNNKVIIYDDACPLCEWYTTMFMKYGLLSKDGRKAFSQIDARTQAAIDLERACDEIPLVDTQTHEVFYGIDAMVEVLNGKFPFVKPIAKLAPVNWFLRRLYKLISFNRKGILAKIPASKGFDCTPSYSLNYKKFFIAWCFIIATILMYAFYKKLFPATTETLVAVSGVLVLFSIINTNKNVLEAIMQWQLHYLILTFMMLIVVIIVPYNALASLMIGIALLVYSFKFLWQRLQYLRYFFKLDK